MSTVYLTYRRALRSLTDYRLFNLSESFEKLDGLDGSTHACDTEQCGGGVARNMAEALWRLRGGGARLLTAVGDDADGQYLMGIAPGLILDGCVVKDCRTASYASVMDSRGECLLGLGDMNLHNHITPKLIDQHLEVLEQAPLVVLDGNAPQTTIDHVLALCRRLRKPVFFEPTDRRKATKPLLRKDNYVSFSSPNLYELLAMARYVQPNAVKELTLDCDLQDLVELCKIVSNYTKCTIVTMGAKGVLVARVNTQSELNAKLYPSNAVDKVENVSGAGDCFASGFIHGMLSGCTESQSVLIGFEAARKALLCKSTVPSNL